MNKDNNIKLIKKIRKKTGLGILECKKILDESNYNIKLSIKKSLDIKKEKNNKINLNKSINGKILCGNSKDYKYSILLEINSETDFVSNNNEFINFCEKVIEYSINNKIINFDYINTKFNMYKINLISKFNENISFGKKYIFCENNFSFSYVHMKKIGVIINFSKNLDLDIIKKISMHIIASKPKYINENFECLNKYNKKDEIIKNNLLYQKFIFDDNLYIKDILDKYELKIFDFKIIELNN